MNYKDRQTALIKKSYSDEKTGTGTFVKAIEQSWLKYLGYSDKEIDSSEIMVVFVADKGKHGPFLAICKPEEEPKR